MAGYAWLWHSDKQFAITENGIGPYEEGNSFLESNLRDRDIAGGKAILEVGLWLGQGGSDYFEERSRKNYQKSFKVQDMQMIYEQKYLPANEKYW